MVRVPGPGINVLAHGGVGLYRSEDRRVSLAAKQQWERVGALLDRPRCQRDSELTAHITDAAISVMFNIAEGFLRRR